MTTEPRSAMPLSGRRYGKKNAPGEPAHVRGIGRPKSGRKHLDNDGSGAADHHRAVNALSKAFAAASDGDMPEDTFWR